MRTIAHISDLHFGTEIAEVVKGLITAINSLQPSVVAVSGDLTQRAKKEQYIQASEFLSKLAYPQIVIPGNHDISLYNLFRRFYLPLKRFRKYITNEPVPYFIDNEIAVMGINTARSLTFKGGSVSEEQLQIIRDKLCHMDSDVKKVLVVHHNIIPTPGSQSEELIDKAEHLWDQIHACDIDLILAGHVHKAYTAFIKSSDPDSGTAVLASAGTAFSGRKRGEPNSFNYIELESDSMRIVKMNFVDGSFSEAGSVSYKKKDTIWYMQIS